MKIREISENISHTSKRLRDIERSKGIKPGDDEWFKLWFSLPYLKESKENIYDILEPEDCGPFDGGCVLVAQALQKIHGGEIVVLVNDRGNADHAAVKVGNTLIDYDGPLQADKFIKRFEKNERVNITGIRPMQKNDLPDATRNQSLLPKIIDFLSMKKKYSKVNEIFNEETGKEMLKVFRNMHHDTAMNKDMDNFILAHDWELRDFTPDMFPSEEEFFDYDDPFDRVIDIDYSHRVDLSAPIIVGPQFSDGKYSVIDGNHRAAAAQRMGKTIKGYFPVNPVNEVLNSTATDAKWTMSDEDMSRLEFTASNGIEYQIDFLAPFIGPDEIHPEDFVPNVSNDAWNSAVFVEFSQKNATGAAKQGVAGTGAAAEVFGIVTNAILDFARKRKPSMIYFQAAEINRRKLYAAIANRLVKSMSGYTVKQLGDKFAVYSNALVNPATNENFADGKVKGKSRPGRVKRAGASCDGSVTDLRKRAKNSSGEKAKMYHWCANMKSGRKKSK
jgi:hypothetical protein